MHGSNPRNSSPRIGSFVIRRVDVIAAFVMIGLLLSASVVAVVVELDQGSGQVVAGQAGTPRDQVAGAPQGGTPSHRARPSSPAPTSRPPSVNPAVTATPEAPFPVSYDSSAPSPQGATANNASTLSWTHNVSGGDTALLVAVAVGQLDDSGLSASAADDGTAMAALAKVHDNNKPDGFLEVFGLAGVPDGTNTILVTVAGGPATQLTGGSESFTGAAQAGTFTAVTAAGDGATPSVTVASRAGGLVAAFAASGSPILGTMPSAAQKFIADDNDTTGAGNSAGAASAATGSPVTVAWSALADFWAAVAVLVNN
jgi:hypothetical protein